MVTEAPLLDVVKTLNRVVKEQPTLPLRDQGENENYDPQKVLVNLKEQDFTKLATNDEAILGKSFKDESTWAEMAKPVNLKHLFKCMVRSTCSFTSENAAKFRYASFLT